MPTVDTPYRPLARYPTGLAPLPTNISDIAPPPASIGSIIRNWPAPPPVSGNDGGASSTISPRGRAGPGTRGGRLYGMCMALSSPTRPAIAGHERTPFRLLLSVRGAGLSIRRNGGQAVDVRAVDVRAVDVRAGSVLCRVTVEVAGRRLDVGLPADVPLAELLPSVVAGAGAGVAEHAGEGWA